MKQNKTLLLLGALVVVGLYHLVFFLSFPSREEPFWISYGFTLTAFGLELFLLLRPTQAVRKESIMKLSIDSLSVVYCIGQLLLGFLFTAGYIRTSFAAVVQAIWVGLFLLLRLATQANVNHIQGIEQTQLSSTTEMQELNAQAENLSELTDHAEMKAKLKSFVEAVAYSDPVGSPALSALETQLLNGVRELKELLRQNQLSKAETKLQELQRLLAERNAKCRQSKAK